MKPVNHSPLFGMVGSMALCLLLTACGGGGGGGGGSDGSSSPATSSSSSSSSASSISVGSYSSAANTAMLTVDNGFGTTNQLYTTVKVCAPGSTTNCKTVDHVLVDTGSTGLRLMASALGTTLINGMTARLAGTLPMQECMLFGSGHTWGSIKLADFTIGTKSVSGLPLQVINDGAYAEPSNCTNSSSAFTLPKELGANGIIGIAPALQDCGSLCATSTTDTVYYSCTSSSGTSCSQITVATGQQVPNPVSLFSTDNNGVVISLPTLSADTGANTVTGTLIFGIDTSTNNRSTSITAYGTNSDGFLSQASYTPQGSSTPTTYASIIIDSGSNGYFFQDSNIRRCVDTSNNTLPWYCPASVLSLSTTLKSATTSIASTQVTVPFSLSSAAYLFNTGRSAFNNVGAYGTANHFIIGLPFFYGRNVYFAFNGKSTTAATGPYVGY